MISSNIKRTLSAYDEPPNLTPWVQAVVKNARSRRYIGKHVALLNVNQVMVLFEISSSEPVNDHIMT